MPWKNWSSERLGLVFAILAALGFSFKAIFVKLAYAVPQAVPVDSVTLLCLRMAFSVPVFAGVGWRASRTLAPLTRRDWLAILALGLLGYYGASILDFIGLRYITASLERLILFTYPTLTILIGGCSWANASRGASWARCCCPTRALAWPLRTTCMWRATRGPC